jgi:integrase
MLVYRVESYSVTNMADTINKLSDVKIRAVKPRAKIFKLSDGKGLQLWIDPRGYRLWRLAYRYFGTQKVLAIGPYPDIGLAKARDRRDEARALLRDGKDPAGHRRAERVTRSIAAANTFRIIADELIARKIKEGKSEATVDKVTWLLDIASKDLGQRPITEISAAEVLVVLRKLETRGRLESAKRLRSVIGEVFRLAIATARAANDPTFALKGALIQPIVTNRPALIKPEAIGAFLRASDGFTGQPETGIALQLLPILFPRPGELTRAEWREFEVDRAVWVIPAANDKNRRGLDVPLPRQAIALLDRLKRISGHRRLAFPGTRSPERPISDGTLNAAIRRLGYSGDEVVAHGFRATASTRLNEAGIWSADVIEAALGHASKDRIRGIYNRAAYWDERVRMAQWWADYLDGLKNARPVSGVAQQNTSRTRTAPREHSSQGAKA